MFKILYKYGNQKAIDLRRRIFYAFIFPHFVWTFPIFFYLTQNQQEVIVKSFSYHLKLAYGLENWPTHLFFALTGEYTLLDRLFIYWTRFEVVLMNGSDTLGLASQWNFYQALSGDDRVATLREAGVRVNSRQMRLFSDRYVHVFELWFRFRRNYRTQFAFYVRNWSSLLSDVSLFFSYPSSFLF